MKIRSADGQSATVFVQGHELGSTDEVLSFDASGYRDPLYLDVVLSRPGYVPTLHTLTVQDRTRLWEPPPLAILKPSQDVRLRVDPPAQRLYREHEDGGKEPVGTDSELTLEVGNLPFGNAFRPPRVVVHLEREGYVPARVILPEEVWFSSVYPPKSERPIELLAAPGWRAWWHRHSQENPLLLVVAAILLVSSLGFLWLRFHYLKKLEVAHRGLTQWVGRLDTFVEGSRELAAPLTIAELADCGMLQAKRLCGSDWEAFLCSCPEIAQASDASVLDSMSEISAFMANKRHPIRVDDASKSRFAAIAEQATSLLGQPLLFKGEYYGMLILGSGKRGAFSSTDQEALSVLASQVAASVERIRLHEETVAAYRKLTESEAQLIQSAKMAAVGQLAAGVAHELNTPLNAITFGVEMAETNVDKHPARAKKRLALVMNAAKRATGIVKKLLYYSREATVDDKIFNLDTLLYDTRDFLDFQLKQDDMNLEIAEHEDCQIRGNLNELSQVLSNLILNARDAILKGDFTKTIAVQVRHRVRSVEILVTDHAAGVCDEVSDKIFDPFFTTKNLGEGTGLGLSISRKIMEKHGGSLTLESPSGPCTFCMRAPSFE